VLALGPWALRRVPRRYVAVAAASVAHCCAVALAGGDWMSLFRLMVPALPGLLLLGAATAEHASAAATAVRTLLAVTLSVVLAVDLGPQARSVWPSRIELITAARSQLASAQRVAAVDIGWVGAATSAHVVDLAGITDPTVALLPGGHTSKRIAPDFLRRRGVDHVLLLLPPGAALRQPWYTSRFSYAVEQRIVVQARQLGFEPLSTLKVGSSERQYLILRLADHQQAKRDR
jgi:hypothetical protein